MSKKLYCIKVKNESLFLQSEIYFTKQPIRFWGSIERAERFISNLQSTLNMYEDIEKKIQENIQSSNNYSSYPLHYIPKEHIKLIPKYKKFKQYVDMGLEIVSFTLENFTVEKEISQIFVYNKLKNINIK